MSNMYFSPKLYSAGIAKESMRKGFGQGLKQAGEGNEKVVALSGDLTESVQMQIFAEAFPERFVQVGVAEQNLVGVASGMAAMGRIPFTGSYAAFSPGRNWEQIRTSICLNEQPVIIVGSHAGITVGPDGATHQMLEDIALMRSLPNMVVVAPADSVEAQKATLELAELKKPAYLRLSRDTTPVFTSELTPFEFGKAQVFRPGSDISVFSTGTMTYECLMAAKILAKDGLDIEIVHFSTIKPLDEAAILASVKKTGRAVTVEEAQIAAGFGGAIAEVLSEKLPTPLKRIGVDDRYGESGSAEELKDKFGLNVEKIAETIRKATRSLSKYHRI